MHGVRRVILFCALTTLLPITLLVIPLYLRHNLYANVAYAVTESDILEMSDGVSTIFCSSQTLQMNGTFNAFQMSRRPEVTTYRKHIRLKKSMTLPDDTLEYWGFYLLRGATVALSVCSRFPGASILVVKGDRSFSTCGLLDHNDNKARATGIYLPQANEQVKITFESNAQIFDFEEPTKTMLNTSETKNHRHTGKPKKMKDQKIAENKTRDATEDEDEITKLEKIAKSYVHRHMNDRKEPGNERNVSRKLRHARKHLRERKAHVKLNRKRAKMEKDYEIEEKSRQIVDKRSIEYLVSFEKNLKAGSHELESLREELAVFETEEHNGGEVLENDDLTLESSKSEKIGDKKRHDRYKRNHEPVAPPELLDHGIQHGGNALRNSSESSVSSFEEGLLNCYEGQVLLAQEFEPSELCTNVSYLVNGKYMQTRHDVSEDGYYYYIFYSDNDIVFNDIHALFDIYKPTFQYENVSKSCVNKTECTFPLTMWSADRVIVEVPTKDGIDHEQDDISLLVSICHPRMAIYTIFPIAVLFLVICCAFM